MQITHIGAVVKSKKDKFPLSAGHLGNIAEDYFVLIVNNYRMIVLIASISAWSVLLTVVSESLLSHILSLFNPLQKVTILLYLKSGLTNVRALARRCN